MRTWLSHHWRTLGRVLGRIIRDPLAFMFSVTVIGITLCLPAGLFVLLENVKTIGGEVRPEPQVSIFLKTDIDAQQIASIETRLKQHPGVRKFQFISRDHALRDLQQGSGLADVTQSLGYNPLPDVFVIDAKQPTPQALDQLQRDLQGWPEIEMAKLDTIWAKRLHQLLRLGEQLTLFLAILLAIALVTVIGNTIRLQILTQQSEIEVSKLFGATNRFVRLPFLYSGALQGLLGGLLAWLLIEYGLHEIENNVMELAKSYGANFSLVSFKPRDSIFLLGLAAGLGWLSAYFTANRYLKKVDPQR